ncbi:hypothetical protein NIES2104_64060 [Leptolyngbya sp. NIES-2104]|nr:hypothetical protein NIES2104_64060 [Leptolyngbya sp. NIES-2104]
MTRDFRDCLFSFNRFEGDFGFKLGAVLFTFVLAHIYSYHEVEGCSLFTCPVFLFHFTYLLAVYRVGIRRATEAKKLMAYESSQQGEEDVSFQMIKEQKTELEEQFALIKKRRKLFRVKLLILLGQIVLGILLFISFLYIVLASYINLGFYSNLPKYSDALSALIATGILIWVCSKLMNVKSLLAKIKQLSDFHSWGSSLLNRVVNLENKA